MRYRPEIDGLRAVAVVPVVLFHGGIPGFSGGYVGVDVFFVISGYLITSIILKDIHEKKFSFVQFYARRARRILPALLFILVACLPFAWMWMTPGQLKDFGQGLVSVSLFASNILFWMESDYFAPAAELNPLLHTWSLAIEEQFYIIFPVFLLLIARTRNTIQIQIIFIVFIVSFVACDVLSRISPVANFYLLPTRAWELLLGSLCAYVLFKRSQPFFRSELLSYFLSVLGIFLIGLPIFIYDSETRFPSFLTLAPVIGTCLIILVARSDRGAGRWLATSPLVALGLISYSTYLWHQPLMAFARIRSLLEPSEHLMIFLAIISFVMGWFSWRFIEQPFRRTGGTNILSGPYLALGASACFFALIAVGLVIHLNDGLHYRLSPLAANFYEQKYEINPMSQSCHFGVTATSSDIPRLPIDECIFGSGDEPSVAFLGDSHGNTVSYVFASALAERGVASTQITFSGCMPFPEYNREVVDCLRANDSLAEYIFDGEIDTVVITGRYGFVYHRDRFDNGEGGTSPRKILYDNKTFTFDLGPDASYEDHALELFRRGIDMYLQAGLRVVLVYPIPEAGWNVPLHLVHQAQFEKYEGDLSTDATAYLSRYGAIRELFDSLGHDRLVRVDPFKVFCNGLIEARCMNSIAEDVLYYDDHHLSQRGARLLVPSFLEAWDHLPAVEEQY